MITWNSSICCLSKLKWNLVHNNLQYAVKAASGLAIKMGKKIPRCRNSSKVQYKNYLKSQIGYPSHTSTSPLTFLSLYKHVNKKVAVLNKFYGGKSSLLVKWCSHASESKTTTLTYNRAKSVIIKNAIILMIIMGVEQSVDLFHCLSFQCTRQISIYKEGKLESY